MVERERGAAWSGDDEAVDWQRLSRLALWGAAAAVAVALAVVASQTRTGAQRLAGLYGDVRKSAASERPALPAASQLAPQGFDAESETKRLSESIRLLTADRDRLIARIATLERHLDDMTGSASREPAAPKAAAPVAPASPPPQTARVETPPANLPAIVSGNLPPPEQEGKPEFGAEIGSAPTLDGLRTFWSVLRSNYPQYFDGLRPLVAMRETRTGTVELRLIVGPLSNAAAARLCATLVTAGLNCQPATFEGQRLALR